MALERAARRARQHLAAFELPVEDPTEVPRRPIGRYVTGLALIAVIAIGSTMLTSNALTRQEKDAGVVTAAASQIQRSRDIVDVSTGLAIAPTSVFREASVARIDRELEELTRIHDGLRLGDEELGLPGDNSSEVQELFGIVQPHFESMVEAAREVRSIGASGAEVPDQTVAVLIAEADLYETGMSSIVFSLQGAAESRVAALKTTQFGLLSVTLLVLVFEGLFLFRPAVQQVQQEWEEQEERHRSARRDDQKKLSYLARFDPLTGLINRFLFGDRLQGAIARARRDGGLVALMFLDLDEFKAVNDRFGHATGDALLKQVAQRLEASVRESDSVARLGGDEFTVILEGNHRVEDAGHVATKILKALEVPYTVGHRELHVTASIGIALYPIDGDDAEALLRDADIAMYSAKAAGRNTYQYFTPELREQTSERLQLIDELRQALEAGDQLELAYQPKIDALEPRIIGVEALVRWNHPKLGKVPPARFVPLAEETDLIIPLGEWVLFEACRQMKAWEDAGLVDVTVSVNVSSRQLRRGSLVETVAAALDESGLRPGLLEIELTEGTLVDDTELARRTLERLRSMGVRIAIDDFGTGYSSLSYLQRFSIDALKIDRAFVRDIIGNDDAAALSAAIIGLAKSLRLDVIAEGVETTDQLQLLIDLGCSKMQGFLVSRPLAPDRFEEFHAAGLGGLLDGLSGSQARPAV